MSENDTSDEHELREATSKPFMFFHTTGVEHIGDIGILGPHEEL